MRKTEPRNAERGDQMDKVQQQSLEERAELGRKHNLELRRLHRGGLGWFVIGSLLAPPVIGCGCMACEEALDAGLRSVPEGKAPPH